MLSSLIQAHLEIEKELECAISDDAETHVIESIDKKLVDLDKSIRASMPGDQNEARTKLNFYLSRIAAAGSAVLSQKDIESIEELFDHIIGQTGNSENNVRESTDEQLISNFKS